MPSGKNHFRAGDWIQVRSVEEISLTLDEKGQLDHLPFMPEMLEFCGQRFQVSKRAHKTCDPPSGLGIRSLSNTVHLDNLRCNGKFHGGCQAACLTFWKEAWLKPVSGPEDHGSENTGRLTQLVYGSGYSDPVQFESSPIWKGCRRQSSLRDAESPSKPVYVCQSSQVAEATQPIAWWDGRQYIEDYSSGNASAAKIFKVLALFLYRKLEVSRTGIGWFLRTAYDSMRPASGDVYPWRIGAIPDGVKTPSRQLNLRPGELVRVKSYREILQTLNESNTNRGMWFDPEMVRYCGGTFRVLDRVERILDERSGQIQILKNDCIILENVVCTSCYIKKQKFCPRGIYSFWREIWLERVNSEVNQPVEATGRKALQH